MWRQSAATMSKQDELKSYIREALIKLKSLDRGYHNLPCPGQFDLTIMKLTRQLINALEQKITELEKPV
jgi:hypothetical protein